MQIRPACTCMCLSRARRTYISHFLASDCIEPSPSHVKPPTEPLSEPRRAIQRAMTSRPQTTRPRPERLRRAPTTRPRPERLRRAPTTSTTRPRRNDDRREEWCYDNHDHSHDDRSKSSRTGQLHRHRSDFYPKISTLLIFIFNIIFITTFLHK